ncbi:type II toxin-antitoxin system VapC family toxin [Frankia sp. QA3]|uniref:type II toxin-antitoxin system VapC family toxin n=1 Tax=Frankia sp. QA3 TaxID=710111 RepID=UPI0002ED0D42|nr:type II toxin-antitoxin system VapC family toxin [Frankia sp. QA3]
MPDDLREPHRPTHLIQPPRHPPPLGCPPVPGRRLILDTNILIAYEGGVIGTAALDDDELAVASVTVAEYRVGIELADSAARAADRARSLAAMTTVLEVLDYTATTAVHHARLIAATRQSGRRRGARDLIIAAHAAETGRIIVSSDAKARFADLPGVLATQP